MDSITIARDAHLSTPEIAAECRLRALEDRYRNELMGEEERMALLDRTKRLRTFLGGVA